MALPIEVRSLMLFWMKPISGDDWICPSIIRKSNYLIGCQGWMRAIEIGFCQRSMSRKIVSCSQFTTLEQLLKQKLMTYGWVWGNVRRKWWRPIGLIVNVEKQIFRFMAWFQRGQTGDFYDWNTIRYRSIGANILFFSWIRFYAFSVSRSITQWLSKAIAKVAPENHRQSE